ncbi:MAG: AAA family ATPase [Roseimicrobium sp.]
MAFSELVESLRTMIVSHREHDDAGFRHGAEAIIRSLTVQNRPSEARTLKEALRIQQTSNGATTPTTNLSISVLTRQTPGLISFVSPREHQHLVLRKETDDALNRVLIEHRNADRLAQAGLSPRRKLLFWGPPGCGKTATAQWLAHQLGMPFGVVRLASLITSYVGETGSNIQKVLHIASQTPMVLLIDEADAISKSRDDENDVGELRRVVNSLLQGLDAFSSSQSIVILASNHTHLFDAALWRRFDDVVEFPLPSEADRLRLLRHLTSGLKLKGSLLSVAKGTAGCSYAEVERAVYEVAKATVIENRSLTTAAEILAASKQFQSKVKNASLCRKPKQRR